MSDFKAKMHQIRFQLGPAAPDPAGELTARPQTGFKLDLRGLLLREGMRGRGRCGPGAIQFLASGRHRLYSYAAASSKIDLMLISFLSIHFIIT